jgi:hypothetical protein
MFVNVSLYVDSQLSWSLVSCCWMLIVVCRLSFFVVGICLSFVGCQVLTFVGCWQYRCHRFCSQLWLSVPCSARTLHLIFKFDRFFFWERRILSSRKSGGGGAGKGPYLVCKGYSYPMTKIILQCLWVFALENFLGKRDLSASLKLFLHAVFTDCLQQGTIKIY